MDWPLALFIGSRAIGRTEDRRRSSSKKTKKRKKSNAEVGVVQEVYMENFMCHRKLTVPLGR